MRKRNFTVDDRSLFFVDDIPLTGSENVDVLAFSFDSDWDGLIITAMFVKGNQVYNENLINNEVTVPTAIYTTPGKVSLYLKGRNVELNRTLYSFPYVLEVAESGYQLQNVDIENLPDSETWDLYTDQMLALLAQAQETRADCEAIKTALEALQREVNTTAQGVATDAATVARLKAEIEAAIADANLRISEYNANAEEETNKFNRNALTWQNTINAAGNRNVGNVEAEGTTQKGNVTAEGTKQVKNVKDEGTAQVSAVNTAGTAQVGNVNSAGAAQVENVNQKGTSAVADINTAKTEALEAIEEAGESYDERLSDLELIKSNLNTAVAEGDNIHITDSLNAKPEMIVVKGGAVTQNNYTGKNKFTGDFSQFNNIGGEGTTYAYFKLPDDEKQYTLTLIAKNAFTPTSSTFIGFTNKGGLTGDSYSWVVNSSMSTISKGTILSKTSTNNNRFVSLYSPTATTLKNFTDNFDIILEEGASFTSYEPYTNEQSAPNPNYQVPIVDTNGNNEVGNSNENLYDFKDTKSVTPGIVISDDGWVTVNYDNSSGSAVKYLYCYTHNLNLKTNKHYLIVTEIKNVSGAGGLTVVSDGVSAGMTGQFLTNIYKSFSNLTNNSVYTNIGLTRASFETSANGLRTIIQFAAGQSGSIKYRLSVLEDTTITAETFKYVPHQGSNNQLRLGDIYLGDLNEAENLLFKNVEREDNPYYDSTLEKDKWYWSRRLRKLILNGTENWEVYSGTTHTFRLGISPNSIRGLCSHYKNIAPARFDTDTGIYLSQSNAIIISDPRFSSVEAFKEWLVSENVTVLYARPVANILKTKVTDENLLEDLANMEKNMRTYKNITEIYCVSNSGGNAPVVALTYLKDDRVEINSRLDALEEAIVAQNS